MKIKYSIKGKIYRFLKTESVNQAITNEIFSYSLECSLMIIIKVATFSSMILLINVNVTGLNLVLLLMI